MRYMLSHGCGLKTLTLHIPGGQVRPSIADMTICAKPPVAPPNIIKGLFL